MTDKPAASPHKYVVLKFGGTSVATAERWKTIADQAAARVAEGLRPVVVCSAVTKISDLLEKIVHASVAGDHEPLVEQMRARHLELAQGMGIDGAAILKEDFDEIGRLALGASLLREWNPRLKARVMATGELMSTKLGAAYLNKLGVKSSWVDARTCFLADDETGVPESRRLLNATVSDEKDAALVARFDQIAEPVLITQGFIARDGTGGTVLLGRGGSDTSAAYFAAKLSAVRCEIWTDVPGVFTADPRLVPSALLLRSVGYGETQEIASMGAKVLHPRCIAPCRKHRIPLQIRWTERPDYEGTVVAKHERGGESQVKAICHKRGVTLVSMDTTGMWQQVGFLADFFSVFKNRGLSVDLVSTSEMNVTCSLDAAANTLDAETMNALAADLKKLGKATIIPGCASVALVGRRIRAILHKLAPVLQVFEEHKIHLVTQAASDLNITFVVDEAQAERLVRSLHALLFGSRKPDAVFGVSWRELFEERAESQRSFADAWWKRRRDELLALAKEATPLYVYDEDTIRRSIEKLTAIKSVDRRLYALKANPNVDVLKQVAAAGMGFECVSPGEIERVLEAAPGVDRERILFTPNFAPRTEYQAAFDAGVRVTVDNLHPIEKWPETFKGRSIFLRLDPGKGRGHHDYVKTAGNQSKFGIALADLDKAIAATAKAGAKVVGLHAHVGSGHFDVDSWADTALALAAAAEQLPDVTVLDLGGGLGVPEKPGATALDLGALDETLARVKAANPRFQLWLEPGRYVVAEAGVLLGRVAQVKSKGGVVFVGSDVGMNTLIRPALYGAYHEIVNLTRLGEKATQTAQIVGPICESADVLGYGRVMPPAKEGDVLLIAVAGAYGRAMSSTYNLRAPAAEKWLKA